MRIPALTTIALAATLLGGCKATRDAMINKAADTPETRQKMVTQTSQSCMKSADKQKPGRSPEAEATIQRYCDCAAGRIVAAFTPAEFAELGLRGMSSLEPAQQAKMDGAIEACKSEVGIE